MKTIIYAVLILTLFHSEYKAEEKLSKPEDLKRKHVQQIYTAELGIKESTGKNDGPRIEEYLRQVGLKKGDPWCAAFVCWVFDQASVANLRTGWSPALFPKGRLVWERGKVAVAGKEVAGRTVARQRVAGRAVAEAVSSLPQRGDVFGIWFPEKQRIAHVGFVDHWSDTWLITVEGNTNEAGSREGDGVLRKRRLLKSIYQVANFIDQ